jgi:hypothetical protein
MERRVVPTVASREGEKIFAAGVCNATPHSRCRREDVRVSACAHPHSRAHTHGFTLLTRTKSPAYPPTHATRTHSLSHSRTHSLLSHSVTLSLSQSATMSIVNQLLSQSLTHSPSHSVTHTLIHPLTPTPHALTPRHARYSRSLQVSGVLVVQVV